MDRDGYMKDWSWSSWENARAVWAGGKPSKATPADRRLRENKQLPPRQPQSQPQPQKKGK